MNNYPHPGYYQSNGVPVQSYTNFIPMNSQQMSQNRFMNQTSQRQSCNNCIPQENIGNFTQNISQHSNFNIDLFNRLLSQRIAKHLESLNGENDIIKKKFTSIDKITQKYENKMNFIIESKEKFLERKMLDLKSFHKKNLYNIRTRLNNEK